MAGTKGFIFDPQDAYNLLVHYTGGELPLNGQVRQAGCNAYLPRLAQFLVESEEWTESTPMQIRYDGKRVASWSDGQGDLHFEQKEETPKLQ